jgi:hypothetical protein
MDTNTKVEGLATPWNKGKLLGQKPPLKLMIWAIRIRLQLTHRSRELALFNLAIDIASLLQLRSGVMPCLARRLRSSRARGRSSLAAPRKDPAPRPRRSLRHRRERG